MAEISTKPYLIRAIYEWCTDSGYRPYIAVAVDEHTMVPREFVRNGEIVLNVSAAATNRLRIGNDLIEFEARFGGAARSVSIPINNVSAIYAQETGHGMAFEVPKALALVPDARDQDDQAPGADRDTAGSEAQQADGGAVPSPGAGAARPARAGSSKGRGTGADRRPRLAAVAGGNARAPRRRRNESSDAAAERNGGSGDRGSLRGVAAVREAGPPADAGTGSGQAGVSRLGNGQARDEQAGDNQAGNGQAEAGRAGLGRAGDNQAGIDPAGDDQAGTGEAPQGQVGDARTGSSPAGSSSAGSSSAGSSSAGSSPAGSSPAGGRRVGAIETGADEPGAHGAGADQAGARAAARKGPGRKASVGEREGAGQSDDRQAGADAGKPAAGSPSRPDEDPTPPPAGRPRLTRVK